MRFTEPEKEAILKIMDTPVTEPYKAFTGADIAERDLGKKPARRPLSRGRGVPKNIETTRIKATFTIELPKCRILHTGPADVYQCFIHRKMLAVDAIGGGIQANMHGINERLMGVGASDVHDWEVD